MQHKFITVVLLAFMIHLKAGKNNIFSHDTYSNDLIFKDKDYGTKIAFLKNKQLGQFAQLFLDNSKNLYTGDNPKNFIDYLIKNKDQKIWGCDFKNKLDIMSCTINKNLVGFVCFLKQTENCKNYDFSNQADGAKVGYIALLCVNKNYRQQKIGTLLISSALEELCLREDVRHVTILTTLDNLPAQNLFAKIGFEKVKEDKVKNTALYKKIWIVKRN
jgi:ribosomal protein S18 acetylase RimI-like enzyme